MAAVPDKILIVVTGPTAVGKTEFAIALAQHFGCDIVNADSRQCYNGMPIGTAAPDSAQQSAVRHRLFAFLEPDADYDVSRFERDALNEIADIHSRSAFAVLCGGSGLYVNAVCHGLDALPDVDQALRDSLNLEYLTCGADSLRRRLRLLDPDYCSSADLANPKRLIRALEVCITTGKPYSSLLTHKPSVRPFVLLPIALNLPREELRSRIESRTLQMIKAGLEKEARNLLKYRHCNALNTVGYKELFMYFDGQISLTEATQKIITNTWRYARKQITWLNRFPEYKWLRPHQTDEAIGQAGMLLQANR